MPLALWMLYPNSHKLWRNWIGRGSLFLWMGGMFWDSETRREKIKGEDNQFTFRTEEKGNSNTWRYTFKIKMVWELLEVPCCAEKSYLKCQVRREDCARLGKCMSYRQEDLCSTFRTHSWPWENYRPGKRLLIPVPGGWGRAASLGYSEVAL